MSQSKPLIAIIGGTGDLGTGLAWQLLKAGHEVIIGSRTADKAHSSAEELSQRASRPVRGLENSAAAQAADVVMMTVPFAHHEATLENILTAVQGKIFVDTTVPLMPPKVARVQLPEGGSAARQAQIFLGEDVRVVSAFQNVAAAHLQADDQTHDQCDVLVTGNNPDAREVVVQLAEDMGMKAWHAGAIDNSAVAEALTSVLIFMNKRYKIKGAGIKIIGSSD